jgi:hypothetical protein
MRSRTVIVLAALAGLFLGAGPLRCDGADASVDKPGFCSRTFDQIIVEWDVLSGMGGGQQGGYIMFDYTTSEPPLVIGVLNDRNPFEPLDSVLSRIHAEAKLYPASVVDLFAWEGCLAALRADDLDYVRQLVTDIFWEVTFYFVKDGKVVQQETYRDSGSPIFIREFLFLLPQRDVISPAGRNTPEAHR